LTALEPAQPGSPAEEVFPPGLIKFQEADISQVLDVYQELTGRTVMRPANLPATKVTIRSQTPLTRKEAIQALDSILSLNGISMIPIGEKFVNAVPAAQAGQEGRDFNELALADIPESGSLVAQVVRLTNALPRDVAQALQPFAKLPNSILGIDSAGILVLRDYAVNVKRMLEVLEYIDVVPQQEFIDVVIPIKYALAGDIAQVIGSLTAGGGTVSVGRQQANTGLTGVGGGGRAGAGGLGGGAGGFGGAGGLGNQYNPNQAGGTTGLGGGMSSATGTRSSFADRLRGIVNQATQRGAGDIVILGTAKIIADERTNSLLIFASKQDLVTISNIIEKLDVVLPQVLIEAIIMEVSLGDELRYGLSYLQRTTASSGDFQGIGAIRNIDFLNIANFIGSGGASNAVPGGFSYIARFGDKFDITATAAANDSRINVLSRPRIQTSHAVEANLFVGRTRPYVTGQYYYGGGFGGGPQTQFQQQQIGITLSVLPLINPDGLVVMDIRQRIQSIGKDIPIDANFSVPETIDREANAKVSVRDRETIILGGFISNERTKSKSGVPILKDLPLLGPLFSSNSRKDDRNELIVLMRPTVLPNPQDAAIAAEEEKARMPGIAVAEQENKVFERKLLQRAQKEIQKSREKE
jgi:type II secretory pathway component GspD/PulD (secretin)